MQMSTPCLLMDSLHLHGSRPTRVRLSAEELRLLMADLLRVTPQKSLSIFYGSTGNYSISSNSNNDATHTLCTLT
jgi:hypothetical protein